MEKTINTALEIRSGYRQVERRDRAGIGKKKVSLSRENGGAKLGTKNMNIYNFKVV